MLERKDLRNYQRRAVKFLKDNPCSGMFVDMGMGKTISTLTALADLLRKGQVKKVLLIAPLRVCQGVWKQESRKWDHTKHLRFSYVIGSESERLRGLNKDADVYLVNVENIKWLVYVLRHYARRKGVSWMFDTLVIDESSMFKTANTQRFGTFRHVVRKFQRRHILTGTPSPNGLEDVWSQVYILDRGERLCPRIGDFRSRFFDPSGFRGLSYTPREESRDKVANIISDIVMTLRAEDWLDLPPEIKTNVWVDLPPKVRCLYDKMELEMFLQLDKGIAEAKIAAGVTAKCHQIANGAIFVTDQHNEKDWQKLHDAKIDALEEVVNGTGCPMLVAYYFQHDLARLRKKYPKAPAIKDCKNKSQLDKLQKEWNAGKHPVLFVHPQGSGHGLNLQDGGYAITFFSLLFGHEPYRQVIERIGAARQVGKAERVLVKHILARNTVDEALLASQIRKFDDERSFVKAVRDYREVRRMVLG
jgi:SNF2 family DNA or RNA helicase